MENPANVEARQGGTVRRYHLPVVPTQEMLRAGVQAPELLTNSAQGCFTDCNLRFWFRYWMGYQRHGTVFNLWFGNVTHLALETYWKARQASGSKVGLPEHFDAAIKSLPEDCDPFVRVRLEVMLKAYVLKWDKIRCTVLHVELSFDLPLRNPVTKQIHPLFRRAGKIDLILQFNNGVVLVEHKTSSADLSEFGDYRRRLTLDEQIGYYTEACESLGMQVTKIIYDVLLKPDLKPIKKTPEDKLEYTKGSKNHPPRLKAGMVLEDETIEQYRSRVVEKVIKDLDKYIHQISIPMTSARRKKVLWDVWSRANQIQHALENDYFPANSRACLRQYGTQCDFLAICEGTDSLDNERRYVKMADKHPELGRPRTECADVEEEPSASEDKGAGDNNE